MARKQAVEDYTMTVDDWVTFKALRDMQEIVCTCGAPYLRRKLVAIRSRGADTAPETP